MARWLGWPTRPDIITLCVRLSSGGKISFRPGSHLRQNRDKSILITQKSVKILSSVDHTKCDLLVSSRTTTCPRGQIFKGAVVLPWSRTFYEQQTFCVFLLTKLSIKSLNLEKIFASHFTLRFDVCCLVTASRESWFSIEFSTLGERLSLILGPKSI